VRAIIRDPTGTREHLLEAHPLLVGDGQGAAAAAIALAGERPFVQPLSEEVAVFLDQSRLGASHWITERQALAIGELNIDLAWSTDQLVLTSDREIPVLAAGHQDGLVLQTPIDTPLRRQHRVAGPLVLLTLTLLGLALWYVLSARMLQLQIEPLPDRLSLDGTVPVLPVADGYLAQPGTYTLRAERSGYHPLITEIEVGDAPNQRVALRLDPLPGYVSVATPGVQGAQLLINGDPVGITPLGELELEPGEYELRLRADRYVERVDTIRVEGLGVRQELSFSLTPAWAPVRVESATPGAELWVDGEPLGALPLTVELSAGPRELEVRAPGHKPWQDRLEVLPDQPQSLNIGTLAPADGRLRVTSRPPGANVAVDGRYAGRTPLTLSVSPGEQHELTLNKRGYRTAARKLRLDPAEQRDLGIALAAETGTVRLQVDPDDALLFVEGRRLGTAQGAHALPSVPPLLEIRRKGFEPEQLWVTPRPGLEQTLVVNLRRKGTPVTGALPARIEAPDGTEMVLIRPGTFTMGASRREPGRRANETLRRIELTRPYYLATTEVTNAQFQRFKPEHRSGSFQALSLDDARQPAVNVTWADAAAYCHWLDTQAGGRKFGAAGGTPDAGYRLPTEAEWAWAARYAGRTETARFPWGESLPPPSPSGNFADRSVAAVLASTLEDYDDGYAATAPPARFAPDPSGIFDLAGNVAEWVHDFYAIQPPSDTAANRDPSGPADGKHHVIRGSSWMQASVSALRWSYRDYGSEPRPDVGFRCARDALKEPSS
jgi:formylglycine-generating enzyme required for sulfatase activity